MHQIQIVTVGAGYAGMTAVVWLIGKSDEPIPAKIALCPFINAVNSRV